MSSGNQPDASEAFINAQLAAVGGTIPNIAAEKAAKKREQNQKYRSRAQNTARLAIPSASGPPTAPAPAAQSGKKRRRRRTKAPESANPDGNPPDPEADGSGTAPPPRRRRRTTPPAVEEQHHGEETGFVSREVAALSLDEAGNLQRTGSDTTIASGTTTASNDSQMLSDDELARLIAEEVPEA